jgi:hypothetical protein
LTLSISRVSKHWSMFAMMALQAKELVRLQNGELSLYVVGMLWVVAGHRYISDGVWVHGHPCKHLQQLCECLVQLVKPDSVTLYNTECDDGSWVFRGHHSRSLFHWSCHGSESTKASTAICKSQSRPELRLEIQQQSAESQGFQLLLLQLLCVRLLTLLL